MLWKGDSLLSLRLSYLTGYNNFCFRSTEALDLASAALADGQIVPLEATKLMAKTPIPFMPFRLWRWLYIKLANRIVRQWAAANQVGEEERFAQPYAEVGSAIGR